MAELADALDLGSSGVTRGGSTPPSRTLNNYNKKSSYDIKNNFPR